MLSRHRGAPEPGCFGTEIGERQRLVGPGISGSARRLGGHLNAFSTSV